MNIGGIEVIVDDETDNFIHFLFGYNHIKLEDYQELYDKGYRPLTVTKGKGFGIVCEKMGTFSRNPE